VQLLIILTIVPRNKIVNIILARFIIGSPNVLESVGFIGRGMLGVGIAGENGGVTKGKGLGDDTSVRGDDPTPVRGEVELAGDVICSGCLTDGGFNGVG
jgi:hypothetical protein